MFQSQQKPTYPGISRSRADAPLGMDSSAVEVFGFPGYFVDVRGNVWSRHRRGAAGKFGPVYPPVQLKPNWTNRNSDSVSGQYLSVTLTNPAGVKYACAVHMLVCTAFCGPRSENSECRHLDGDRSNNAASNLAWGSRSDNRMDQRRHGRLNEGEAHGMARLTASDVIAIRASTETAIDLAKMFACSVVHIYNIKKRKVWKSVP